MWLESRLRAFAAVARHRSFSRAAEELHVSQPAVSRQVALLERELGVQLVVRRPQVSLTQVGAFLADYLHRAESLLGLARQGVRSLAGAETGRLQVGASGTPGTYLLPDVLVRFSAEQPGVELQFRLGTSGEIVRAVLAHELELGVVGGLATDPELEVEPLLDDVILPVGAPELAGERLTPRRLEALVWVHREEGSATRVALESALQTLGIAPARRISLPSWEAIKLFVSRGSAVAACSRLALSRELAAGTLAVLDVPGWRLGRSISLIWHRDAPLGPAAALFAAHVREHCREQQSV